MAKKTQITDAQIIKALRSLKSSDLRNVNDIVQRLSSITEDMADNFDVEVDVKLPQPIFRRVGAAVSAVDDALSILDDTVTVLVDILDDENMRRDAERLKSRAKRPQKYIAYSVKNSEFVSFSRDGSVPRWTKYRDSAAEMELANGENLAKRYPKLQIVLMAV